MGLQEGQALVLQQPRPTALYCLLYLYAQCDVGAYALTKDRGEWDRCIWRSSP